MFKKNNNNITLKKEQLKQLISFLKKFNVMPFNERMRLINKLEREEEKLC